MAAGWLAVGLAGCEQQPVEGTTQGEVASTDAALFWGWRPPRCENEEDCLATADDCPSWANVIEGTDGDDVIEGTSGGDCILGHGGNDVIRAGSGHDVVFGGAGNDEIDGGRHGDRLFGGPGNDRMAGGKGFDLMFGGGCHDLIEGDRGLDFAFGGAGYDACEHFRDCETSSQAGDVCASDADCGPDERCESPVGICVPADAESCSGPSCEVTDETDASCDGVDGDCDGAVDEGYEIATSTCGEGLCENVGEVTCLDGALVDDCQPIGGPDVDDGNPCTADSCDPVLGEVHEPLPVGASCSDGDMCNGEEVCGFAETPVLEIGPTQTYLRSNSADTTAMDAAIIDLSAHGFAAGDAIELEAEGSWRPGARDAAVFDLYGVFSASGELLSRETEDRVPDAVPAPLPGYVSPVTLGSLATDIPEDFVIPEAGVAVTIPSGATHLFFGTSDSFYGDNRLVDMPLGVVIRHAELACLPGEPPADACMP